MSKLSVMERWNGQFCKGALYVAVWHDFGMQRSFVKGLVPTRFRQFEPASMDPNQNVFNSLADRKDLNQTCKKLLSQPKKISCVMGQITHTLGHSLCYEILNIEQTPDPPLKTSSKSNPFSSLHSFPPSENGLIKVCHMPHLCVSTCMVWQGIPREDSDLLERPRWSFMSDFFLRSRFCTER